MALGHRGCFSIALGTRTWFPTCRLCNAAEEVQILEIEISHVEINDRSADSD